MVKPDESLSKPQHRASVRARGPTQEQEIDPRQAKSWPKVAQFPVVFDGRFDGDAGHSPKSKTSRVEQTRPSKGACSATQPDQSGQCASSEKTCESKQGDCEGKPCASKPGSPTKECSQAKKACTSNQDCSSKQDSEEGCKGGRIDPSVNIFDDQPAASCNGSKRLSTDKATCNGRKDSTKSNTSKLVKPRKPSCETAATVDTSSAPAPPCTGAKKSSASEAKTKVSGPKPKKPAVKTGRVAKRISAGLCQGNIIKGGRGQRARKAPERFY